MDGFPDVDAVVEQMVEGAPKIRRTAVGTSSIAGTSLAAVLLLFQETA